MASKSIKNLTNVIYPNWQVASRIKAFTTTISPVNNMLGYSTGEYKTFNLATHVGDDIELVIANRRTLVDQALPSNPVWLAQCHSDIVVELPLENSANEIVADASFTTKHNVVCAVLTADCVPILITNVKGNKVCAIHAGWQGLVKGVIESVVNKLTVDSQDLICWIGPCIGQNNTFEIGTDTLGEFLKFSPKASNFIEVNPATPNKWFANLPKLAAQRLEFLGVNRDNIYFSGHDTFAEPDLFYSYRRSHITGRMASCIWIEN